MLPFLKGASIRGATKGKHPFPGSGSGRHGGGVVTTSTCSVIVVGFEWTRLLLLQGSNLRISPSPASGAGVLKIGVC